MPLRDGEQTTAGVWVLAATILGSSLAYIDGTVVNVALPALQTSLHASATELQWVIEGYALFLAALMLVGGSLGDLFGRRRVFLVGVCGFALASAWCGLAPTIGQLIAARAVQGLGAALLVPGSLALISSSFAEEERGRAIGTWSGFSAITTAIGPVLGGWLVEHGSWRWVFFINLPLALAVVLITLLRVPETARRGALRDLDWAGIVLATAGLGAVTYALLEWTAGGTGARVLLGVGVLLLALFVVVEARAGARGVAPMLPLQLFGSRNFSGANLQTLLLYGALAGAFYYLPINLIQVQRYSPAAAGAAILPFILLISLLSRWSGDLVRRSGPRMPLIAGPAIAGVGFALLTTTGLHHSYWTTTFPAVVVLGLGMAISVAPLTTVVMDAVAQEYAGAASGVNNAVSRVAGLLSLAVFGLVMTHVFDDALSHRLERLGLAAEVKEAVLARRSQLAGIETGEARSQEAVDEAFVRGYDRVVLLGAALCGVASLSGAVLLRPGRIKPGS